MEQAVSLVAGFLVTASRSVLDVECPLELGVEESLEGDLSGPPDADVYLAQKSCLVEGQALDLVDPVPELPDVAPVLLLGLRQVVHVLLEFSSSPSLGP